MLITNDSGSDLSAKKADLLRESSSTIKVPILLLALKDMVSRQIPLEALMDRKQHHNTKGSGILNWTDAKSFNFEALIETTLVYSDCLATNMLLDFIGGQKRLNEWLAGQGLMTRLDLPYLHFTGSEDYMPKVGTTSAREMLSLYKQLDNQPWPKDYKDLLNRSMSNVHESWLELNLPGKLENFKHKTGSMINCGPMGETVYNAVGSFGHNNAKYYFCLLSRDFLNTDTDKSENSMKQYLATSLFGSVAGT